MTGLYILVNKNYLQVLVQIIIALVSSKFLQVKVILFCKLSFHMIGKYGIIQWMQPPKKVFKFEM